MPKITVYADFMSQPVRSVVNFLKINKIQYEIENIFLSKKMNRSDEYLKINPHGTIPSIKVVEENNKEFILNESCTILRYLSYKFNTPENWYNRIDLERRCLIDQYLDWHHSNTRKYCIELFFNEFFLKKKTDKTNIEKLLKFLDSELFKHKYIIDNEISIADLMLYNELIELYLINFDFSEYPSVEKFLKNMNNVPEFKETNNVLRKVTEKRGINIKF